MELYIGMDLGGTDLKLGIIRRDGSILAKHTYPTPSGLAADGLADYFASSIRQLLDSAGVGLSQCAGVGIGAPGLVNSATGELDFVTNIPLLSHYRLGPEMSRRLGLPVTVDNDVNAMALAELYYGAARGCKQVVAITVGTGVGGGIIIDGKLHRGASFSAGELGHMSIETNGPLCNCGNYGCLERYIGREAIVNRFNALHRHKNLPSTIGQFLEAGTVTPRAIAAAAAAGDELAGFVLSECGRFLGNGLASIVNILNPEVVVVGGGIANAGELLLAPARAELLRRAYSLPAKAVRVVQARFLNDAGIIGAASLALGSAEPAEPGRP